MNELKSAICTLRLTPADKERIRRRAEAAGLTMTEYLTRCALGRNIVVVDGLTELAAQVKAVGRNLNQQTLLANMGRITVYGLEDFTAAFNRFCQQLYELSGRVR